MKVKCSHPEFRANAFPIHVSQSSVVRLAVEQAAWAQQRFVREVMQKFTSPPPSGCPSPPPTARLPCPCCLRTLPSLLLSVVPAAFFQFYRLGLWMLFFIVIPIRGLSCHWDLPLRTVRPSTIFPSESRPVRGANQRHFGSLSVFEPLLISEGHPCSVLINLNSTINNTLCPFYHQHVAFYFS